MEQVLNVASASIMAVDKDLQDESSALLNSSPTSKLLQPSLAYKVLRTISLVFIWVGFGCFSEVTGPVLPELIAQTNSDYQLIAQSVSMRGVGHAVGGVIGGLSIDRWLIKHIDIWISFFVLLYTVASVGSAYIQSIALLYLVFLVQGSIETVLQTIGYRMALIIWKKKAAGPLHAIHMGYSLGSVFIPQLVTPFLDPRYSGGTIATKYNSSCQDHPTNSSPIAPPLYPPRFVTVYWMLSGITLLMSLIFLIYFIHGRLTGINITSMRDMEPETTGQRASLKEGLSFKSCSPSHPRYAGVIVILLMLYYVISVPLIRAFSKFVFSYARDGPCLTVGESTALESVYFAAVTVGRFSAFIISSFIHMKYVLQMEVLGVLISALGLFFWHDNITLLWTFVVALGFFTGPVNPSAFAWANNYIEVSSTAQILPQIGAAIGDFAMLSAVGYSYQQLGPFVIWSYLLGLAAAIVGVSWLLQINGYLHGDRYTNNQNESAK